MATAVARPADSINFGQSIDYTSEAKSTYLVKPQLSNRDERNRFREKFQKQNINFGQMSDQNNKYS